MVYILNTEIKDNKQIIVSFRKVFGLGQKRIENILKDIGLTKKIKTSELNNDNKKKIINFIEKKFKINNELKQTLIKENENLSLKRCYRGIRRRNKLPRRGQRTHTNAKTVKKVYL